MFGNFPGHAEVCHFGLRGLAFGHNFQVFIGDIPIIAILDENTAGDITLRHGRRFDIRQAARNKKA